MPDANKNDLKEPMATTELAKIEAKRKRQCEISKQHRDKIKEEKNKIANDLYYWSKKVKECQKIVTSLDKEITFYKDKLNSSKIILQND